MRLGVREAAEMLDVSEKTIYRWIGQDKLPFYKINEQYRFNRAELLEWATGNRIPISAKMLVEPDSTSAIPGLEEALRAGGINYRIGGQDKPSALRSVVEVIPLPEEVDRNFLLEVLLARESLGSTGVGDGIAIPHVRNPIVMHIPKPMVSVCFLENAIDFMSIDGKPVHTLFTILSPTIKAHLNLLSRLAYALRDNEFNAAIVQRASREQILAHAGRVDRTIVAQTGPGVQVT
jgi:PTS system nitrogen regulatory IIA component